jgi:hypothetical protein
VNVVQEYDKQSLYHMLLKCFYHLHSMAKSKIRCVKQMVNEDFNLDFFNRLLTQMIQQKKKKFKMLPSESQKNQGPFQW